MQLIGGGMSPTNTNENPAAVYNQYRRILNYKCVRKLLEIHHLSPGMTQLQIEQRLGWNHNGPKKMSFVL